MRYLIPYHESKNEHHNIREIKGSVVYGSLATKLLIAFIIIIIAFAADMSLKVRLGLLTMAFVVVMDWYYDYYVQILQAYYQFNLVSSLNYIKATVSFVGSVILIYFFNIYGVYLSIILTLAIAILYLRLKYPLASHSKFKRSVFVGLVRKGFPLMILNLSTDLISSIDKIIIVYFIGTEKLGYYAIAVMVHHFTMNIPVAARAINETRLMKNLNNISGNEIINEFLLKPFFYTAYYMPFLIGPLLLLLPVIIPIILPRYIPGIIPAQILALGCYPFSLFFVTRGIIIAHNWQVKAAVIMFFALIVNIILSITLLKMGLGIIGVAIGSSSSLFILFICILFFVVKKLDSTKLDLRTNLIGLCWPFLIMCAVIFPLEYVSKFMAINVYLAAFMKLSVFYIIMYQVIKVASMKYPLLKSIKLKEIWRNR